jgi:SAM-dependent methyltransferase
MTASTPPDDPNAFMYERYLSSGGFGAIPATEADLASRSAIMRDLVRRFFPNERDAKILDLGCGSGVLLLAARREGYRNLAGVDGSAEQVAVARRLGIDEVRQGDLFVELAPVAPETLDVVITYDVIEHLTKPSLLALMREVHRVLKAGGRWIIHAPNGESPFFGRIRYGDFTHELAFTRQSLPAVLRAGGFFQVACMEEVPVVHGLKSALRFALWKLIRLAFCLVSAVETGEWSGGIYSQNFIAVAFKPATLEAAEAG